ncbi:UNVERIFIED_CONTAM: hypothetical protein FKN15_037208 [Acipenser sinensis]
MAAARAVLEKCTMMLLTASKTCLRHPDCDSARINKDGVFQRMRLALEQVIVIVTEARPNGEGDILPVSIYMGIREFKVRGSIPAPQQHMGMRECKKQLEGLREGLCLLSKENLTALLEVVLEHTEDFTDLAYTSHEHRERILELSRQARLELEQLNAAWMQAQNPKAAEATEEMELAILKTCQCMNELKKELHNAAAELAADLLKYHADHIVLKALKVSGGEGSLEALAEYTCKLSEQKEQLVETCRLLRHISGTEPLEITCIHAEDTFQVTGPQIISAAHTLALHPSSKIAKENLDVFCEAWESQLNDMSILLREIIDLFEGRRGEKRNYLSLPRPGEQTAIAKVGLELRLLTSDLDSESEKWEDQEHEIARQGQGMSSMAYSMYLFTSTCFHFSHSMPKLPWQLYLCQCRLQQAGFKLPALFVYMITNTFSLQLYIIVTIVYPQPHPEGSSSKGQFWCMVVTAGGVAGVQPVLLVLDCIDLQGALKEVIGSKDFGGTKTVSDFVKAGGTDYNVLFDNCHDGSKRMMDQH